MIYFYVMEGTFPSHKPMGLKQCLYNILYLEWDSNPTHEPEPVVFYEI